jgi:hypothetical protein
MPRPHIMLRHRAFIALRRREPSGAADIGAKPARTPPRTGHRPGKSVGKRKEKPAPRNHPSGNRQSATIPRNATTPGIPSGTNKK